MQADVQVVQQRLDGADVQNGEAGPAIRQHPGENGKEGRFRLSTSSRGQDDQMLTGQDGRDDVLLKGPQVTPAQTVDDVMLQSGM